MKNVKHYILILAAQILLCTVCVSQTEKVRMLKEQLPSSKDTALANRLNKLSYLYCFIRNDSAEYYALKAIVRSKKMKYGKGHAIGYYNLALNELKSGTYPTQEKYAQIAITLLEEEKDKTLLGELAKSYQLLGLSLLAQAKFDRALEGFRKGEAICIETGDTKLLSEFYAHMATLETQRGQYTSSIQYSISGLPLWRDHATFTQAGYAAMIQVYNRLGDYETSLDYGREGRRIVKWREERPGEALWTSIGETFFLAGQYDSAIHMYSDNWHSGNKVNPSTGTVSDVRKENLSGIRIAEVSIAQGKYDIALSALNNALPYFESTSDRSQIMWTLLRMAKIHTAKGSTLDGIQTTRRLLNNARETGARQYVRDSHLMLHKLYAKVGMNDSAYHHLRLHDEIKATIDADKAEQRLAFFKSEIAREQNEATVRQENDELKIQDLQLAKSRQLIIFLVIVSIALAALAMLYMRTKSLQRRSTKHKREDTESDLRLQKLVQENMKSEIQRRSVELEMQALRAQLNPHFIFNSLNSINRFIQQNNKTEASTYLTKFSRLIRLILQNSQTPMVPLETELESLELYLELEALRLEHRFHYTISVSHHIDVTAVKVPSMIIQPYVENAIWHGLMYKEGEGNLHVDVQEGDDQLIVKVSDDGVGREQSAALANKSKAIDKSAGLRVSADRIAMFSNGDEGKIPSVTINDLVHDNGTPGGTEVIIRIPFY